MKRDIEMKVFSICMPDALKEKAEKEAAERYISLSALIRIAVGKYLEENKMQACG